MADAATPLIASLSLEGFLSFGYGQQALDSFPLGGLNVVIGANGSGKSNLIEALSLLRAVPQDLPLPIRQGGGVADWIWRGSTGDGSSFLDGSGAGIPAARIDVVFGDGHVSHHASKPAIRYQLTFGCEGDSFVVVDERLENAAPAAGQSRPYFYFGYENGRPMINVDDGRRELRLADIDRTQSIVSQRKDPDSYPELTRLGELLGAIRIYRNWSFGPDAQLRAACRPDVRTDYLAEDFSNLPARLQVLKRTPSTKRRMVELLRELAPAYEDFDVIPEGGTLNLYLTEGDLAMPARRLSDGTLRFLCLIAVLVDPSPSPLTCIEEPELGLHPDIQPKLAEMLLDASQRTQLVVTTHSDVLVDALTANPEAVVVCEKRDGATALQRLDARALRPWLEDFRLGELWTRGEIGGTRW